jgi:hypothetical protein
LQRLLRKPISRRFFNIKKLSAVYHPFIIHRYNTTIAQEREKFIALGDELSKHIEGEAA